MSLDDNCQPIRRVVCSQIGARDHYLIPRALRREGMLSEFYTDFWAPTWLRSLARKSKMLKFLASRYHPDLTAAQVRAFNAPTLGTHALRKFRPSTRTADFEHHLHFGKMIATRVGRCIARNPGPDAFVGYCTALLESFDVLDALGVPTVACQMDAARVYDQAVRDAAERWPGWQVPPPPVPEAYYERLESEWHRATRVLVNSGYSAKALIKQGVPADKLVVVPLAYEMPTAPAPVMKPDNQFVVLFLGRVTLTKGIAVLFEAAGLLKTTRPTLKVVVAGPIEIDQAAIAAAPANVVFTGRVSRDQAASVYASANAFVLPTLSDGFGMTQLEAMANGLPVVTTPNCGEVVTDGVDGLLVPAGDAEKLAEALETLAADPQRTAQMGLRARETAGRFSLDRFASRLAELVTALGQPVAAKSLLHTRPLGSTT